MMPLRPIVIDENNIILGGNMRFKALKELGYSKVPESWIKRAEELTEAEKREFIIKDNVGFGEWDWDILSNQWNVDELKSWSLDVSYFFNDDIELVNKGDENSEWVDMPDFEQADKEIKLTIYFTTELERTNFVKDKDINITKNQNGQLVSRL